MRRARVVSMRSAPASPETVGHLGDARGAVGVDVQGQIGTDLM